MIRRVKSVRALSILLTLEYSSVTFSLSLNRPGKRVRGLALPARKRVSVDVRGDRHAGVTRRLLSATTLCYACSTTDA